jgi:hypothetical protein
MLRNAAAALAAVTLLAGCAQGSAQTPAVAPNGVRCTVPLKSNDPTASECMERLPGHAGVRCSGAFGGKIPLKRSAPPVSYAYAEIVKTPLKFYPEGLELLRRIKAATHSNTLRVAMPTEDTSFPAVIYDAARGPCADVFYEVLNSNRSSHVYYNPGDNPYALMYGPGDVFSTPYPWFRRP